MYFWVNQTLITNIEGLNTMVDHGDIPSASFTEILTTKIHCLAPV